jgi:hypothetical protein
MKHRPTIEIDARPRDRLFLRANRDKRIEAVDEN